MLMSNKKTNTIVSNWRALAVTLLEAILIDRISETQHSILRADEKNEIPFPCREALVMVRVVGSKVLLVFLRSGPETRVSIWVVRELNGHTIPIVSCQISPAQRVVNTDRTSLIYNRRSQNSEKE